MMRITVWGINYAPELTGIGPYNAALCEFLRERGHAVRMVTTFAYYPAWHKRPAERGALFRTDDLNGVKVHRCWHYVPRRATPLRRMVHEATFVLTSLLRQLTLPRADLLVVVSPPLLLGAAAWVVGRVKRMPFLFHVQDLQPGAAASLGMVKHSGLLGLLRWLEQFAYRQAALVSGITPGMLAAFARQGVGAAHRLYAPNPVALPVLSRLPQRGRFRQRIGLDQADFLAVYSGNLGVKQGLDGLVEAARRLTNTRVHFVICGEGSQRDRLLDRVHRYQLPNLVMVKLQPPDRYFELLMDADVCLIPQQHGSDGCFFPSKLLNTLACARPVLTVADDSSELVQALREGGFGMNVPPGQPEALAEALEYLAENPALLERYAQAGRQYVERFDQRTVLGRFESALHRIVAGQPAGNEADEDPEPIASSPPEKTRKAA